MFRYLALTRSLYIIAPVYGLYPYRCVHIRQYTLIYIHDVREYTSKSPDEVIQFYHDEPLVAFAQLLNRENSLKNCAMQGNSFNLSGTIA